MRHPTDPRRSVCILLCVAAWGCGPQVHRIAGPSKETPAFDVLFVGAGFDSNTDLDAFRTAAQSLADGLLETPPFSDPALPLRVWRIDVRDPEVDASRCGSGSGCSFERLPPSHAPPRLPLETLNPRGKRVVRESFEVVACPAGATCRSLWLSSKGQERALRIAPTNLHIDAVVVLANTTAPSGSGLQEASEFEVGLAVVGLPNDATGKAGGGGLLAHELAHVAGLADEYTSASGEPSADVERFPNVWRPDDPCVTPEPWGSAVNLVASAQIVPWSDVLHCNEKLDEKWDCDFTSAAHACPRVWFPYHPTNKKCSGPRERPSIQDECLSHVGLFEGAYYAREGIYRPMFRCRMSAAGDPFCTVCERRLREFLEGRTKEESGA